MSPDYDYDQLVSQSRLNFVFKPLKPSRFADIFDPQKVREMSTDRNHDSVQQIALTQKQIFDELTNRLGNGNKRVLLVEDNRTNQLVSVSFYPCLLCQFRERALGPAPIVRWRTVLERHFDTVNL